MNKIVDDLMVAVLAGMGYGLLVLLQLALEVCR